MAIQPSAESSGIIGFCQKRQYIKKKAMQFDVSLFLMVSALPSAYLLF